MKRNQSAGQPLNYVRRRPTLAHHFLVAACLARKSEIAPSIGRTISWLPPGAGGTPNFVTTAPLETGATQHIDARSSSRARGSLTPSLTIELIQLELPPTNTETQKRKRDPNGYLRGIPISRNHYAGKRSSR